ncbi:transient receptor potential channel pyrexia [Hyalella azteca]|uniref:Transient receptor potential channel pyrexia n=1 Tax=Hyalella azteca TaxID=294128 RepID=A0A8B7P8B1_HYAAZ|nr:transient receptor potential channel pyrexia [Hyalella azteca]
MAASGQAPPLKMQLLKRTVSCISPEDHQQQHPCFTKLLKAVTDKDLNTFKRIFVDKELTINYQEPVRGNRSALHYAAKGNFREGLQYLVLNDANCNIQDNSGVTPLHLAANEGFPDIARELICNGASVEIADNRGRNALHWALTTSSSVTEDSNDDILKVVKMLLLRCNNASVKDNEGRLPLHLAARSGITAAVQLLLNNPKSGSVSAKDDELLTPLHYAVMGAQSLETVSFLIKRGANLDAVDKNGQTPMHLLVGRKPANVNEEFDIACLEILLNNGASVSIADRDNVPPLTTILSRTMWWNRGSSRDFYLTIVQMLVAKGAKITCGFSMWRMIEAFPSLLNYTLNHSIATNTSVDNSIHLVLEFDMRCFIEQEKLNNVSDICQKSANDAIVLPDALTTFTDVSMLHYLSHSGNKHILCHPLCRSFLHLKWLRIRKYFIANFILSCLFVWSITFFVFSVTNCSPYNNNTVSSFNTSDETVVYSDGPYNLSLTGQANASVDVHDLNTPWHYCIISLIYSGHEKLVSWILLSVMYVLILLREILQISHCAWSRMVSFNQALMIILMIFIPILLIQPCPCENVWWVQMSAVVIVGGWITLLLSLGQFPTFGVYVVMFSTVATNVLKFLGLYMLLLIGFAFGFHVLLRPYQTFYSLFVSLSTTFVMMTGELDYEAVFVEGKKSTEILGILLLLFFIFLIYIILSNLLVGLAVSDLTSIRKRSEVMRLCSQVELMVQFEEVVRSNLWPKCIKNIMKNSISLQALCDSPIISILPNKKRGWVTTSYKFLESFIPKRALNKIFESFVDGFIPPEWEPRLPDNLLRACLKIAQKQFEMQKRDRLLKQRRNTSRGNTVIAKMPVPKPKTDFSLTAIPIPGVSMHDAEDEDSDDSTDSSQWDCYPTDSHPFISTRRRHLTLKKSSRSNLFRNLSLFPGSNAVIGVDNDDARQLLSEIQAILISANIHAQSGAAPRSRRNSNVSKKSAFSEAHV